MVQFEGFTILITFFILSPILGAFTLMFLFIFERRIDLLENKKLELELERSLQQAVYNQLNQQIEPHFLFNTLNAVLSLARLGRTEELVKSIESLSLYFKFKYQTTDPLIPFSLEAKYAEYYLDIQKLRFGPRLHIDRAYESGMEDAMIPPFLLQTLVENAFKHGLEHRMGEARLSIQCHAAQGAMELIVTDNGCPPYEGVPEVSALPAEPAGHGLDNIRRRLKLYFGENTDVRLITQEEGGTVATARWPLTYTREKEVMR
ncbi:ATPase [Paenibacillus swuensis]|uniref:ATPase n=1 Tax=Paenibacillus swuensis TaxID=1178515 RepID=A0A172TDS9_9BACL|nr:histidine kinase [Paenibacillus swuensis]ANE45195.1 ATPase [Paenibacillus swuensis]